MVPGTHFQVKDIYFLFTGVLFIVSSIALFRKSKVAASILLLSFAAFFLRFFVIRLDPFIYLWDEQFHALVAKNMLLHPLTPMLYNNPVLPYNISNWSGNYIWLHKPPFFLWLIAISFKLFGINEIALRIPSVLLSTLLVPVLYRMGTLLFNKKAGYYCAFIFALANYQIEMVSGIIGSDHNDVAFMFFITLSFWALIEYRFSRQKKWLYLIGLFSGTAILVKWIMGFLVFFCWGLTIILDRDKRFSFKSYKGIITSFMISLLVAIPWQVYIFLTFPKEAYDTYFSYANHFTSSLDEHTGGECYHLGLIGQQFGWLVPFILIPAIYYTYRTLREKKAERIILISWIMSVYIFYAIVKTKMPLFTIISCPVIFLVLGNLIDTCMNYIETSTKKLSNVITWCLLLILGYSDINPNEIETHHTDTGSMQLRRSIYIHNTQIYKQTDSMLNDKTYIIFNCKGFNYIPLMFYSGTTAYANIPDSNTLSKLEKNGYKVAVFNNNDLPEYVSKDSKILKLNLHIIAN